MLSWKKTKRRERQKSKFLNAQVRHVTKQSSVTDKGNRRALKRIKNLKG